MFSNHSRDRLTGSSASYVDTCRWHLGDPCLPQHGVGQLADLLHVVGAYAELPAADPEQRAVCEFLAVQLHLDEVILPGIGVLNPHFQDQLCNRWGWGSGCEGEAGPRASLDASRN